MELAGRRRSSFTPRQVADWLVKHPLFVGIALCCASRLGFALLSGVAFESDEAIVGLMARHILYRHEIPLFYYGQSYLGPLEPLSAAVAFAFAGPSVFSLRLAPIFYSLVFVVFTTLFARRAFGPTAGLATLAYCVAPPLFLLTWSVKARGGYAELIALGAVSLWLALDLASGVQVRTWRWILLGGVSGLGLWTDPLYIVYLCPIVLYVALRRRARLPLVKALGALVAFAIGVGPMFLANLRSHGETLRELAGPNVSQPTTVAVFRANLVETVREGLPILVGFFEASSNAAAFSAARAAADWPTWILTPVHDGLAVAGLALLIVSAWHAARLGPTPLDLMTWVGACTVGLFCLSQVESLYLTEPRYLLPLYSLIPVAGLVVSKARSIHPVGAAALLACVVALNALSIARFDPALTAPWLDGQLVDAGNPSLARFLEDRGITTFYADYWLAYPVAFQSREQVVPSVIDDQLRVGFNRYIPYAIVVDGSPDPAIVVVANSQAEKNLREMLLNSGRTYRLGRWRNLDVYDHLSPAFRPIRG